METSNVLEVGTDYVAVATRMELALDTLRRELTAMRHQDVKLLKQLILINENIRRLTSCGRPRLHRATSCATRLTPLGSDCVTLPPRGEPPLLRQQSEPKSCLETSCFTRQSSAYSDHESQDDLYSSGSELDDSTSSLRLLRQRHIYTGSDLDDSTSSLRLLRQRQINNGSDLDDSTSSLRLLRQRHIYTESDLDDSTSSLRLLRQRQIYTGNDFDDSHSSLSLLKRRQRFWNFRPRSFSFVSAVSVPDVGLDGGDSAYDEILKRNVKLWKWSLTHDDPGIEERPQIVS